MLGRLEVIAAALLLTFGAGTFIGYANGVGASKNALLKAQQAQMAAADLASSKEAQRLAAVNLHADLSLKLEDAANAQVSAAICLPVSRVLRLNQR